MTKNEMYHHAFREVKKQALQDKARYQKQVDRRILNVLHTALATGSSAVIIALCESMHLTSDGTLLLAGAGTLGASNSLFQLRRLLATRAEFRERYREQTQLGKQLVQRINV